MAIISIPSTISGVTIPGTASNGPLGALFGNKYSVSSLQYPRDLGSTTKGHWVKFEIYQRTPKGYETAKQIADGVGNIISGAKNGDTDQITSGAEQTGGAILGAAKNKVNVVTDPRASALKIGSEIVGKPEIISLYMPDTVNFTYTSQYSGTSVLDAMSDVASKIASTVSKVPYVSGLASAPAMALSAIQSSAGRLALATQGLAINPKQQLLFGGIDFRTYQMAFTFTPYSREEAEIVKKIIKAFKVASAPTIINQIGGMFFVPPKIIQPSFFFNGKENPNISRVTESVIESIDVNYAPNSVWATHEDGAPVQTTLTINFKEIELIDSDMIDRKGY